MHNGSGRLTTSIIIREIEDGRDEVTIRTLIDHLTTQGYDEDEVVQLVRTMLNSGEIGLGQRMNVRILETV